MNIMLRPVITLCLIGTCLGMMQTSCGSVEEVSRSDSLSQPSSTLQSKQPTLHLHAVTNPLVFHDMNDFSLEVFVENLGDRPVTIFPSFIQMEFRPLEQGTVSYIPVEEESASIWDGAFVLKSEEIRKIKYVNLDGKHGTWSLERGSYGLSIRYYVESDQLPMDRSSKVNDRFKNSHLWVGDLQSQEVTIHYVSKEDRVLPLSMKQ